ncbi:MAG TPA: prepilin-type N-terminal cleavage/methylation domain-containing protein, partial [Planctomycetaceae bacterium]|nr:prepilin-type N-terminal cleavage/methylation domain-containing protein [Planctomycetaceae bacterium]
MCRTIHGASHMSTSTCRTAVTRSLRPVRMGKWVPMTISPLATDSPLPPGRGRHRVGSNPSGMTLIEVSLVLALLVVVGAIAYPNIQAPFARQRVRKAAELVRVE